METTFKDSKQRTWGVHLSIGKAMKLKADTGLDLVKALSDIGVAYQVIGRMESDMVTFCTIFHSLTNAQEHGVSLEEFADGMDGDVICGAFEALDQAFTNFYPPEKRETVAEMKRKLQEGLGDSQDQIVQELNRRMPELKQQIAKTVGEKMDQLISGN